MPASRCWGALKALRANRWREYIAACFEMSEVPRNTRQNNVEGLKQGNSRYAAFQLSLPS